jgi:hypothetical protein
MTFEELLTALLELVGERVDVAIESRAGLVAPFTGRLARGHDLSTVTRDRFGRTLLDDPLAPVFFSFDDGVSGFILDPRSTQTLPGSQADWRGRMGEFVDAVVAAEAELISELGSETEATVIAN